jgi:hypothetical protein
MSINLPISHSLFFSLAETLQGEDRKQMTSRPNDREGTLTGTVVYICGDAQGSQSPEFTRIVRDLSTLGESVHIEVHLRAM